MDVDVRDFGAVGDGVTDDTAAIQDAIDEAVRRGGAAVFGAGRYRITSPLRLDGAGMQGMTLLP